MNAQPPENAEAAGELAGLAAETQTAVTAALARLADNPRRAQSRALHRDILDDVARATARLTAAVRRWTQTRLPQILTRGQADAAAQTGADLSDLTVSRALQQTLAREITSNALAATRNVTASVKTLLRRVAADEVLGAMARERTFEGVPARVAEIMARHGVHAVRYSNGALHQIDDYMDMLTRTIAARAYNASVVLGGKHAGVVAAEIQDGAGCTWPLSHGHPPAANGMVVSLELAEFYPIAHPRCVRAILLRPDVRKQVELDDGELPADGGAAAMAEAEAFRRQVAADLRRAQRPSRVQARRDRLARRAAKVGRTG